MAYFWRCLECKTGSEYVDPEDNPGFELASPPYEYVTTPSACLECGSSEITLFWSGPSGMWNGRHPEEVSELWRSRWYPSRSAFGKLWKMYGKNKLHQFFTEQIPHPKHGLYGEILERSDEFWEITHDFIQWVFPLSERSSSNRNAPILASEDIEAIKLSPLAQENLERAVLRYKQFLAGSTKWRSGYDYNHLRISRIIQSLRLLINDESADGFKYWIAGQLGDDLDKIDSESRRHWRLA